MKPYNIRTPIWENHKVGIAEFRMRGLKTFDVKIGYRNNDWRLLYPGIYRIDVKEAVAYPLQIIKGVRLRIIPIENMQKVGK